ncbi:PREDICTED: uncharacterized protein LOC107072703 [Polistes dominula]|uniref:Uncharacterized protein LOC107072703 n=1 Tax=Polistes dominula TaxID=743375 RepID=A0ABM1J798_POLDO|nr:PREDICTED: uncharacterized protein LOC107072703 [Polistes dominula]
MTSLCLVVFLLVCNNIFVLVESQPLPADMIYNSENFADETEKLILINRLKQLMEQERELTEEELTIQAMLEAKARDQRVDDYPPDDTETLPIPSAVVHHTSPVSNKRISYMNLCHFKICNMGRKRQS